MCGGASEWLQFSTQRKVRATFISPQSPVFCLSTTNNHRAQAAQCSQLGAVFCLFFASLPLHGLLSYPDTGQQDEHSGTLREAVWNLFYEAHGTGRGRAIGKGRSPEGRYRLSGYRTSTLGQTGEGRRIDSFMVISKYLTRSRNQVSNCSFFPIFCDLHSDT